MRIALVTTFPPSRHHLSEYGYHLASELRRRGVDFTILGDKYEGPQLPELPGFRVRRCWRVGALGSPRHILSALGQIRPDIVWFNLVYSTFGASALPAFAGLCTPALARASRHRVHVTLHHLMENCDLSHADIAFPRIYRFAGSIATRLLLRADSVSVLLERYRQVLMRRYGATNVGVRFHGTLGQPHSPDPHLRPPNEFRMLALGKWGRYKRLETMLEALPAVVAAVPNARLLIAGCDHPNRPGYLAGLAEKWGANPHVKFLGYLDENRFDEVFSSSHVAVLPYLSSGGPSGVAHIAVRFGLPIVAAHIDDLVQLAEEEGIALDTYAPYSSADLAQRLIALARDPERQARMAEQNYRVAVESTMPRIVASYLDEFAALLRQSPPAAIAAKGEVSAA
jgi:glycosyltransferase involved in cell wall biosynthesis